MQKLLTAFMCVSCLFLFSCQKEVNDIFKGTGGNNTSGLLVKMVSRDSTDSTVKNYIYNGSNKIIGVNTVQTSSGNVAVNNETIVRNSQGIIQSIITKSSQFAQYGLDSVVSYINYNTASKQYTSRVFSFTLLGTTTEDSSAFIYDASGKIVTEWDYISDGTSITQTSRSDFGYSGANMGSLKIYDASSGAPSLQITELFNYDSKLSPLQLGDEAFLINNSFQFLSANNISDQTVTLVGDPTIHHINYHYTYNSSNKPVTVTIAQDGKPLGSVTYYYR